MPLTRSSELARIAADAAGLDTSAVRFVVRHGPAGTSLGTNSDNAGVGAGAGAATESDRWPSGFALFAAAGLTTWATSWSSATAALTLPVHVDPPTVTEPDGWCSYSGLSLPNPGFLNESTRRVDVLVSLGDAPWQPSYRDCLMSAVVLEKLSGLATNRAGGPVRHLHTPVSPPQIRASGSGEGSDAPLRAALGPCIRMSVGVDPRMSAARLGFEANLADLADEFGLGLYVGDRRLNRGRGEWYTIREFDEARYQLRCDELFGQLPTRPPEHALIATAIGPARVGVTTQLISALKTRGIGVLAASICTMQKIGFINLILPATHRSDLAAWSGDWEGAMRILADRCVTARPLDVTAVPDVSAVTDYQIAISGSMPCSSDTVSHQGTPVTHPLWLRWQLPQRSVPTPELLDVVLQSLTGLREHPGLHVTGCEVAYVQARLVLGDVLRGRAKLIVELPDGNRDNAETRRRLNVIAELAQEAALQKLLDKRGVDAYRARLRISPQEHWLVYAGGA